jgi:MFS family permease
MFRIKEHHLHLPHITFDNSNNLRMLFGIRVLRDVINKTSMFFVPVFLYLLGSTSEFFNFLPFESFQKGILVLASYYVVHGILGFLMGVPAGIIYRTIGHQRSLVFSFLLRCIFFILFYFANENPQYLILAVIIDAVNSQLFWGGYYSLLSKSAKAKNMGKDVSFIYLLIQIVAVVTPAISGYIAYMAGIEVLFLIGLSLTMVSTILAMNMDTKVTQNSVSFKEFFRWLHEIRFVRLAASFAGKYLYDASIYIWPLYIFLILGSVEKVGYLYTVSLFLAMVFTYFAGHYVDNHKNKKPFYYSGGILSALTMMRSQVVSVWGIAFIDTFDRLLSNVYNVYFDTFFMRRGKGHSADSFFIYREMLLNLASIVFWGLIGLFFLFFSGWQSLYLLASVGVLIGLLMKDSKHEQ